MKAYFHSFEEFRLAIGTYTCTCMINLRKVGIVLINTLPHPPDGRTFYSLVDNLQLWLSALTFVYGFLMDGAIAVIGLCAMEVVPKSLAGSAHGLACALAQGMNT